MSNVVFCFLSGFVSKVSLYEFPHTERRNPPLPPHTSFAEIVRASGICFLSLTYAVFLFVEHEYYDWKVFRLAFFPSPSVGFAGFPTLCDNRPVIRSAITCERFHEAALS